MMENMLIKIDEISLRMDKLEKKNINATSQVKTLGKQANLKKCR